MTILKKNYSKTWKPIIPKHMILIDKNSYRFPHPVWYIKDAENVDLYHKEPKHIRVYIALGMAKFFRVSFDLFSGYKPKNMNEQQHLKRCIFLETIAGVPGMIGGMMRHLRALRLLREDGGWIHHLLEEAENERMHLLTFLKIRQPGITMRLLIMLSQLFFILFYSPLYMIASRTAHRFVGYMNEYAIETFSNIIKDIDEGKLHEFEKVKPSSEALWYYGLTEDATFRDVLISIRADVIFHREFNHHFADISPNTPIFGHNYVTREEIKWDGDNEIKDSKKVVEIDPNESKLL